MTLVKYWHFAITCQNCSQKIPHCSPTWAKYEYMMFLCLKIHVCPIWCIHIPCYVFYLEYISLTLVRVSDWDIEFNGLLGTADISVRIVHASRVIIAYTLESLSSLIYRSQLTLRYNELKKKEKTVRAPILSWLVRPQGWRWPPH